MKVYKAKVGKFQCQECKRELYAEEDSVIIAHSWNYEFVLCEEDARMLQAELNQFFNEREEK